MKLYGKVEKFKGQELGITFSFDDKSVSIFFGDESEPIKLLEGCVRAIDLLNEKINYAKDTNSDRISQ